MQHYRRDMRGLSGERVRTFRKKGARIADVIGVSGRGEGGKIAGLDDASTCRPGLRGPLPMSRWLL
jgi:hypothetical protein